MAIVSFNVLVACLYGNFAVEEVYNAVGIRCVALRVGNHHYGGALAVESAQKLHHLYSVL